MIFEGALVSSALFIILIISKIVNITCTVKHNIDSTESNKMIIDIKN